MTNNSSNRPVRSRRIDVNLPSLDDVNQAAAASTTYFIPGLRSTKRKCSPRPSSFNSPSGARRAPPPLPPPPPPPPVEHALTIRPNGTHPALPAPSSVYSHGSEVGLGYGDGDRTIYDSIEEDDLPYDPQSTFDMVAETQNIIDRAYGEIMDTIDDEWERADGRLRSRLLASLSIALREATNARLAAL